jgi:hypothetical protein
MRRSTGVTLICAILTIALAGSALASGKNRKASLYFSQETLVGEVRLSPGTYEVQFDAAAEQLSIRKANQQVVAVKVTVEQGPKAIHTQSYLAVRDGKVFLNRIVYKGDTRVLVLQG